MPDLSYPVSAPGYIDTPGRVGNYVHVDREALGTAVTTVEWIVRFRMDTTASHTLVGWEDGAAALVLDTDLKLTMYVNNVGGLPIGNALSAVWPNMGANLDVWARAKLTVATAGLEYWYSFDSTSPVWHALGSPTGTNAATVVDLTTSTPFYLGVPGPAGPVVLDGRIFYVEEKINGTTTLLFDANDDLRGIPFDAESFSISNSGPPVGSPPIEVLAEVERDDSIPKLILVQPSLTRPWWPQQDLEGDPSRWYRQPAFTVQRDIGGVVLGGDTVRGSTSATVEKTALRYPASIIAPEVVQGKGILYTRVYDYETVQIQWGLPAKFTESWYQTAIVRSAFGYPITVTDGQVIYQATKSEIFPNGPPEGPDGAALQVMLPDFFDMVTPPKGKSRGLPGGYWYYYSLFFQSGLKWYRSMVSSSLVPRNYGHSDHLFNSLPTYYQWTDDQMSSEGGDLRRFFKVFGFELDTTREYVESWQKLYWVDYAPMRLLRRLGPNFDLPYEAGIGDVRYRALLADIGNLYSIRGTQTCLEKLVEAVTKCEADVTSSANMLLLPDDSDFFEGTGHWAGLHPDTDVSTLSPSVTALDPATVSFVANSIQQVPPPVADGRTYGRGTASMWTSDDVATDDVVLTIGDGIAYPVVDEANDTTLPRQISPRETAIHVSPEIVYGFSVWLQHEIVDVQNVDIWLMWFSKDGQPDDLISVDKAGLVAPVDTDWAEWSHFAEAPEDAVFCVPAVHIHDRPDQPDVAETISPKVHVAAANFYILGTAATTSRVAPDRYLNLGSTELIGAPTDTPPTPPGPAPFEGYVIGSPDSED